MSVCLIVDDERSRFALLKGRLGAEHRYMTLQEPAEVTRALLLEADVVFLDHDMGQHTLSGVDLVKRIIDPHSEQHVPPDQAPVFYVHSMNPIGSKTMVELLLRYGYQATRYPI